MSIAVYVHFPFCLSICPYCDFDRQASGFDRVDAYLAAVARELDGYRALGERAHSVFFGGGTPSLLREDQLARLLDAVARTFALDAAAEITVECNPGDADLDRLRGFRAAGANRLSFGVQSLDDRVLPVLGRRHTSAEARQAVAWARAAGFEALNLDFMFGLPGQDLDHWRTTLDAAVALGPDHLSCYLLTLDEKVAMGRDVARGRLVLPEDDALADMYHLARAHLAAAGYRQYEVSNWARPGQESRHNLTYWRDGAWLGVGAGAASAFGGRRWKNSPVLERYIAGVEADGRAPRVEDEAPDRRTRLLDAITLGLRLREGIDLAAFEARFGVDLVATAGWLLDGGFLELEPAPAGRLRVAAEHQLVLNEVLVRLAEALPEDAGDRDGDEAGTGTGTGERQLRRATSRSHSAARSVAAGSRGAAASSAARAAR